MLQSIILIDPEATLSAKPDANTLVIRREEGKRDISIDQIRPLIGWAAQHGYQMGVKRAVIMQADQLSSSAANTLLKTLEEPVADTYIILIVEAANSLLETIRSRCVMYTSQSVAEQQLTEWGLERHAHQQLQSIKPLEEFLNQPQMQQWLEVDSWVKAKQDIGTIFRSWQNEAAGQRQSANDQTIMYWQNVSECLETVGFDLAANVNQRLTVDAFLLELEGLESR